MEKKEIVKAGVSQDFLLLVEGKQEEPEKPMGQAITARYLDADAPHVQELIAWIRKLFEL
jgi:hypothetical protein